VFLVKDVPPKPPSGLIGNHNAMLDFDEATAYAASQKSPSLLSLVRTVIGLNNGIHCDARLSTIERADFVIVTLIFGVLVASFVPVVSLSALFSTHAKYSVNNFSILTAQILVRHPG
jgi:hypothetical protein